jgi:hypothetical protein
MKIFIDRITGTWGSADALVIRECSVAEVIAMEEMGDYDLIELARSWESAK